MPPSNEIEHVKTRTSDDLTLRRLKRYLLLLEDGKLQHEALRESQIPIATLKEWRQKNPQFKEAEQDAKAQGVEKYERVLADKALAGDYQSLAKFLEANDPDKYDRKQIREDRLAIVVVDATTALGRIQTLREELERRDRDIPLFARNANPWINEDLPVLVEDEITDAEIVDDPR